MALQIDQITELFCSHGAVQYGREAITQKQHALQCAHLAELAGASPELVTAALLHDLGHLLAVDMSSRGPEKAASVDDVHQYLAIPFLRGVFPDAVIQPIRLHVDAKRYLCRVEESYWVGLSPASQRSLELQGGIFSNEEALAFATSPFAGDAVALRRWDDLAKNPAATPPEWRHYVNVLQITACQPAVTS
jgi:phosphonate degradation associated HDIG domain protein